MFRRLAASIIVFIAFATASMSQDTLPKFTVVKKPNNRNVISWTNPFIYTSQISIQRSFDSTKNFKTILTVPDANVPQNGFVDTKAPDEKIFYRLFIVLDSGKYQFSRSKRPAPDSGTVRKGIATGIKNDNSRVITDSLNNKEVKALDEKLKPTLPEVIKPERFFVIKRRDTIVNRIPEYYLKKFRDSIVYITKDTLLFESVDTILIKPFIPKEIYKASKYVFTEKYGNVTIALPDVFTKKYSVKFFDEKMLQIFEVDEVQSSVVIIDKTNFIHSGWFWFELYEGGKLKEKNKFFLPKDF
ncbi:MAG: hypothetical protein ABI415_07245 [Flavitalea sp.]